MSVKSSFTLVCALSIGFAASPGYAGDVIFCDNFESCPAGMVWSCDEVTDPNGASIITSGDSGGACVLAGPEVPVVPTAESHFFDERTALVPEVSDCHSVPLSVVTPEDGITYAFRLASIASGAGLSGELFTDAACTATIDEFAVMPVALPGAVVYYIPAHRKASYNQGFPAKLLAGETFTYEAADAAQLQWSSEPGVVSFGISSTLNDRSDAVIDAFGPCIEDTPCVFTLATSDPDPDDTHDFLLEVETAPSSGTMHQYDAGQADNVGALMSPFTSGVPVLVADAQHRVVFVPNPNLHTFLATSAQKPSFTFTVTETNTNPSFSGTLTTPPFDVAPTDDAPVAASTNVLLEWDFPVDDAGGGVRELAFGVSHTDLPADAVEIIFTTLPEVGTVRNGAVPVVAGVGMACTYSDCNSQFFWDAPTEAGALGSNALVASIGYTVRDVEPYGAPFVPLGLDSGAEVFINFSTSPNPGLTFVGVVSPLPSGFDEGVSATTKDIVVSFAQPETGPAEAPYLGVSAYPTASEDGDNDDRVHTSGVVFPPSADRIGSASSVTFFEGQTDCAPLTECPDLLETLGALDEPNLRYSGDCDAEVCDFTITVRACTPTEAAVSGCDEDFAGDSVLMLQAHTNEGGLMSVAELPFTVANDYADLHLPAERTYCDALPSNRLSFVLDGVTMPWAGVFCVPGQGNPFEGPLLVDHDLFQLAPFNDGYSDEAGTTWRASIGIYNGCNDHSPSCDPYTLGWVDELNAKYPDSVTFSLISASGAAGVSVTNNPAVSISDAPMELIIEADDLLALRRELHPGVHFNALVGNTNLGGTAIIMKIARNEGAGFVDIAVFGIRISATGSPNDGQLTPYPGPE